MDKEINNNGYDYVDLNLPSGTLWATCNVGASKPSESGLYFQWGDTVGCAANQVGTRNWQKKYDSDYNDYKWYNGSIFTKYILHDITLELEDDAAHIFMGGDWHIPTSAQIEELLNNTVSNWYVTQNGVTGILFTSKKDISKSIFIPAAGIASNGSVFFNGGYGYIWSSTLSTDNISRGKYLYFFSGGTYLSNYSRGCGLSVRGVINNPKENKNNMNENLNLIKILKNVPKETKLWSPICGECKLKNINTNATNDYPIECVTKNRIGGNTCIVFTACGAYVNSYAYNECVLFPSKENHDWSKFKIPKKHKEFKPFQKVLRVGRDNDFNVIWIADFYSHYDESTIKHILTSGYMKDDITIIPYEGNEDKLGKKAEIKLKRI